MDAADSRPWLAHYPPGTPTDIAPVTVGNLADRLVEAAQEFGQSRAFTMVMPNGMNGHLSFADVDRLSDAFAVYLRQGLGLSAGDRVAVQLPNCLAYPVVAFGILKAGCVVVNTNPLYTAPEMRRQFDDAGVSAIVGIDIMADRIAEVVSRAPVPVVLTAISDFFPGYVHGIIRSVQKVWTRNLPKVTFEHVRLTAALSQGLRDREAAATYRAELTPESLACLQYTGGTTGISKGAMLTHGNLMANSEQMLVFSGTSIGRGCETILTALPMYHVFAFVVNLVGFYQMGAHNILIPNPRPLSNLKRAFENYPITWVAGVNTLFHGLVNEEWFVAHPPEHLKASISGGMALHGSTAEQWERVTGSGVVEGYGLTEASPGLTFNPIAGGEVRIGTVGVPLPSTVVRPTREDGTAAEVGEPGELWARGPQIMAGYWQRPEETSQVLVDGWLRTGDIGTIDEQGYIRIVDRSKDVIIVSGFNVFPNEVEDALAGHPGVDEVAVVGVDAGERGERVRAVVVRRDPSLSAADLRAHAATQLTAYKVPSEIIFADALPKSPIGKILRKDVRVQFANATAEPQQTVTGGAR